MADKNTAKLIATWIRSNGKTEEHYRLIGVGKYTAGYTDEYVLERLERDTLGADRWSVSARWSRDNNEALSIFGGRHRHAASAPRPATVCGNPAATEEGGSSRGRATDPAATTRAGSQAVGRRQISPLRYGA